MNRHVLGAAALNAPQSLRLWVLFAALVLLMQFSDPLGDVSLGDAALFWVVRLIGVAVSLLLAEWILVRFCTPYLNAPTWVKPAILFVVIAAVPMTAVEVFLETAVPQMAAYDDSDLREWSPVLAVLSEYFTILSIVLPVNILLWIVIDQRYEESALLTDKEAEFAEPSFLKKSEGISLAEVIALTADEHYVRIWTAESSELVYGRFRDVVAEMPASKGLQVHRSWWVADKAVVTARRGARRYEIELSNGTIVPVSDRFTRQARERGLLARRPLKRTTADSAEQ